MSKKNNNKNNTAKVVAKSAAKPVATDTQRSFQELLIFELITIICALVVIWLVAKMFP